MKSKVILVTGGSSGIGRAIALHLHQLGHQVYASSRSAEMGARPDGFPMVQLDVTDPKSIQDALDYIHTHSGGLDAVINNAGLGMAGPIECTSTHEVETVFATNVYGVLNVCRAAIPFLRKSQAPTLINITSIAGRLALPYRGIYAASKHAVEGFTESLSLELKPHGIRVCMIEPGDFKTAINSKRLVSAEVDAALYPKFGGVLDQIVAEVEHASDPHQIALLVARILDTKKPRLRYVVGTWLQRMSIHIKYWLPSRRFERILEKHYRLD